MLASGAFLIIADILATTEFTVSIMIPSLISLRPLLRKIHKWTTSDRSDYSPFTRGNHTGVTSGKRRTENSTSIPKLKGSHAMYSKTEGRNMYGSEVELTEQELSKIYKTEEISVTSTRDPQLFDEDDISR
jgi:hypothetical protein